MPTQKKYHDLNASARARVHQLRQLPSRPLPAALPPLVHPPPAGLAWVAAKRGLGLLIFASNTEQNTHLIFLPVVLYIRRARPQIPRRGGPSGQPERVRDRFRTEKRYRPRLPFSCGLGVGVGGCYPEWEAISIRP